MVHRNKPTPAISAQSWLNCDTAFIDRSSEVWNFRHDRLIFAVVGSMEPKTQKKGEAMKRTMMAVAAAATLAVSAMAPAPAHAQYHHHGGGVAAGVAAGLIGGGLIGC